MPTAVMVFSFHLLPAYLYASHVKKRRAHLIQARRYIFHLTEFISA